MTARLHKYAGYKVIAGRCFTYCSCGKRFRRRNGESHKERVQRHAAIQAAEVTE